MSKSLKFIVARVIGDEETFNEIFQANMPNIVSEVYSIFDEKDTKFTIFQKYNRGIEEMLKKGISNDDVIIFCHNDCGLLDIAFQSKIDLLFKETDVDVVGVVGSSEIREDGCWWSVPIQCQRGHIIQGNAHSPIMEGNHLIKGSIGYYNDVVVIDGLFMVVRGNIFKNSNIRFRTDIFSDNHFYDLSFSLDLLLQGYKIAVADLLVYHKSQGSSNTAEVWTTERDKFIAHYKGIGFTFPIDKKSIEVWREKNLPKEVVSEITEFKL